MPCSSFSKGHWYSSPGPFHRGRRPPPPLFFVPTGCALHHPLFSVSVAGRAVAPPLSDFSGARRQKGVKINVGGLCGHEGKTEKKERCTPARSSPSD